eukprot:CCRYP_006648-RA/>CCRYP_006648-RA protein AED:0.10 eAED:0.14 QI:294/0/0.5/1/0/0/2/0/72
MHLLDDHACKGGLVQTIGFDTTILSFIKHGIAFGDEHKLDAMKYYADIERFPSTIEFANHPSDKSRTEAPSC